MRPLSVQVITYAPTVFRHCQHCEVAFEGIGLGERMHRAEARDALPDDLLAEYQQVSDWVHRLLERHGSSVAISVIDAASIQGVWQSLRHRVRKVPTVIVDGTEKRAGTDFQALDTLIDARLRGRGEAQVRGRGQAQAPRDPGTQVRQRGRATAAEPRGSGMHEPRGEGRGDA